MIRSNWNPAPGCSISGSATEDSSAAMIPAQIPPLTAATVTASMKIATATPAAPSGSNSRVIRMASTAPHAAAITPTSTAGKEI